MKEFIFGIDEENSDWAEVFYGWIRNNSPELIRCKNCKFWGITIYENIETCPKHRNANGWEQATDPEDFCSWAEKREE